MSHLCHEQFTCPNCHCSNDDYVAVFATVHHEGRVFEFTKTAEVQA